MRIIRKMRKYYLFILVLFVVGCQSPEPTIELYGPVGSVICYHKYDKSIGFAYIPPIIEYKQVLFEQEVITYEFNTVDGKQYFLADSETDNYDCKLVMDINIPN